MKRTLGILIVILMLIPAATHAQAEVSNDPVKLIDPGITPDNFLYYLDVAMDNLALAATFNTDDKINKSLEIAEERLAEAKAMAEKGDYESMEKAEVEHEKALSQLKGEVDGLQNSDPEKAIEEKLKVEVRVKQHDDNVDDIGVHIKGNLTEEQKSYFITILQDLRNQTRDVELDIEDEINDSRDKLGENAKVIEDKVREKQGIEDFEKARAEKMRVKAENKWAQAVEMAAEYNVTTPDQSNFNLLLANGDALFANKSYEEAKEAYETAKEYAEEIKDTIEENAHDEDGVGLKDANKMRFEAEKQWTEVMKKAIEGNVTVPDRAGFDALLAEGDTFLYKGSFEDAKDAYEQARDYAKDVKEGLGEGNGDREKDD